MGNELGFTVALGKMLYLPGVLLFLLMGDLLCSLPAMLETWVRSLSQEDPLEKEIATHSSNLTWEIPWTEEPGGLRPWGGKESDMTGQLTHTHW